MSRPVLDLRTHEGLPIATYEARMELLERALAEVVQDSARAKALVDANHERLMEIAAIAAADALAHDAEK